MKPRISQLAKTTRGQKTARALRARQDYKVATLGIRRVLIISVTYYRKRNKELCLKEKHNYIVVSPCLKCPRIVIARPFKGLMF